MNFSEFKKKYQKQEVGEYPNEVTASPTVSVLVQTYQHNNYIIDCLNGILNQETNFPFEILLGEDGSDDGTREICIEYAKKFPKKIRLFLHRPDNKIKVMGIVTGNFNALYNFFSAKGMFISFCEGDDVWTDPTKLQKQVDFSTRNKDFALVFHCFTEVDSLGNCLPEARRLNQPSGDLTKESLQRLDEHPLLSTICFRNFFRNGIPEEIAEVINVDSFLLSILGRHGGAGFIKNIQCSIYRRHEGGMWSKNGKTFKFSSKSVVFEKLAGFYRRVGNGLIATHYEKRGRDVLKMLINHQIRQGKLHSAIITAKKLFTVF